MEENWGRASDFATRNHCKNQTKGKKKKREERWEVKKRGRERRTSVRQPEITSTRPTPISRVRDLQTYTVFKSKWQIINLCSSKLASPKAFKFSLNVGNNWPFCHVQTHILILNSLGSVKQTEYAQFLRLNLFFLVYVRRLVFIHIQMPKKLS